MAGPGRKDNVVTTGMVWSPLLEAGFPVIIHTLSAIGALLIGSAQMLLEKGTRTHKVMGYLWCTLLLWTAISSFWIHEIRMFGPWSLIHLLSIWALLNIVYALHAARTGRITAHKKAMRGLYFYALILAGVFTLMPGRILNQILFG